MKINENLVHAMKRILATVHLVLQERNVSPINMSVYQRMETQYLIVPSIPVVCTPRSFYVYGNRGWLAGCVEFKPLFERFRYKILAIIIVSTF